MESFLLDTTILVARTVKRPVVSAAVAAACRQMRQCGAAEYAILEYNNAVVSHIGFLLGLLRQKRDLALVREHIDRVTGASFAKRTAGMCRELLTRLDLDLRQVFDNQYPRDADDFHQARAERACALLREMQRTWLRDLQRIVGRWERDTKCYWVRRIETTPLSQPKTVRARCTSDNVRCGLVALLVGKREALERVRAFLEHLPAHAWTEELQRLADAIDRFNTDSMSAANYTTGCRCFADLLHILQADRYDAIFTMNHREFVPLCAALEKPLALQDHRGSPANLDATVPQVPSG